LLKEAVFERKMPICLQSRGKISYFVPQLQNDDMDKLKIEERVVEMLKTVYDPEIPVNVYDLGLIYRIELNDDLTQLDVDMTMTAPSCPMADFILEDVRQKLETIEGLATVNVNLVFEPEWTQDMMTEEAKLELGLL
jgi:FeS assembly SUF system protein